VNRGFPKSFPLALIVAWAGLYVADGIELRNAETEVDTTVVDTAYGVQIKPVEAAIPFKNFRYPFVDDRENVLFIGNDPFRYTPAVKGNGIYRSYAADGRIESLVIQDDPAPDDGLPMGAILGLRTDFRSYVFHRGGDSGTGIYGSFNGGPLVTVAGLKTVAPGIGVNFGWFWYADVCGDLVVFNGSPQTSDDWVNGLYLYDHAKQKLSCLLDTTRAVPAAGGLRLAEISPQPRLDKSWLIFAACSATDAAGDQVAKKGYFGWQVTEGGNPEEMFALERLKVLAPIGMEIPESGGLPLTGGSNLMSDEGLIAVAAGSDVDGKKGGIPRWQAICIRTPDGIWHNPVDTNTLNPILNDGSCFTGFNKWVGVDEGKVIFRAYGDSYEAVYIYDVASDALYFVADTRLTIHDKEVTSFEISGHPLVGKRLAMMIHFSDGTAGEYLATLPQLPTEPVRKARTAGASR
jgi:hypothetical protein